MAKHPGGHTTGNLKPTKLALTRGRTANSTANDRRIVKLAEAGARQRLKNLKNKKPPKKPKKPGVVKRARSAVTAANKRNAATKRSLRAG